MKLNNRFRRSTFGRFFYMNKMLWKHKHYIENGMYVIMPNLRTYQKLGNNTSGFPANVLSTKMKFIYHVEKRLPFLIISNKKKFNGTSIYFTNMPEIEYADIKIFDELNGRVLTFCTIQKRFESILKKKELSRKYYPVPKLLSKDNKNLSYEEVFINHKNIDDGSVVEFLQKVMNFYCKLFEEHSTEEKFIQHGDLSVDNIILDTNNDLYFIDFDHMDELPVFYDLFYLLVNISITKSTTKYLDNILTECNLKKLNEIIVKTKYKSLKEAFEDYKIYFSAKWMKNMTQKKLEQYELVFNHIEKII